ncbi:FmdB family zinc ribbon protein [Pararobbsia alpina]|uniref:FmdB family zinc ribbon protein n=1 Tax=Pararobbsia alpina TaxID=621374 RepID=UPI001581B80E|nr:FmdB family zinc ribbon protein [Pararobbsia alpina]
MPFYDYQCGTCGVFEVMRRLTERNVSVACPQCENVSERIQTVSATLVTGGGDSTESAGSYGFRHRGFCACCP